MAIKIKKRTGYSFQPGVNHRRLCEAEASRSITQVLAAVFGGGTARAAAQVARLQEHWGNGNDLALALARASETDLARLIGPTQASRIKAALELGQWLLAPSEQTHIQSPQDVAALLQLEMGQLVQEQVRVLLLNVHDRLIRQVLVYQGNVHQLTVRVGEVFREAVRENAVAVIVVHNHPSGNPAPSPADVDITRKIVEAGTLLDIKVQDHVVIGGSRYVSMRERGIGFETRR